MLPEFILLALLIGWVSGGKFSRLADAKIKHAWLIFVPIALYIGSWAATLVAPPAKLGWLFGSSAIIEKLCLVVVAAANLKLAGAKLILVGLLLNLMALCANGGIMPADPNALAAAFGPDYVESARTAVHVRSGIMDATCRLGFLCDVIAARRPFVIIPAVISVGDVFTIIGLFIAIIAIMRTPLDKERKDAGNAGT